MGIRCTTRDWDQYREERRSTQIPTTDDFSSRRWLGFGSISVPPYIDHNHVSWKGSHHSFPPYIDNATSLVIYKKQYREERSDGDPLHAT